MNKLIYHVYHDYNNRHSNCFLISLFSPSESCRSAQEKMPLNDQTYFILNIPRIIRYSIS